VAERPDRGPEPPESEPPDTLHLRPLPPATRVVLWILGGLLFAIGVIGLALPIFPQTIPLLLGLAILSLASRRVHDWMERLLNRWPQARRVMRDLRKRVHDRLS
jgi:uncharacterized membrane protein